MSDSVGRVDLDLGVNYSKFNKELNGIAHTAENQVGGAFKHLGLLIAGAFAVDKMIEFGKSAIDLASDLIEVQNVVDVTFGSMAQDVNNFAKNALSSFGLSELTAKRFTSVMGAMLKSSGLAGKDMEEMSKSLTGLSADFASFYNLKPEEAFEKIRSGISGETEPLKQLGINLNVANLQAFALSKGIKKSFMSMTQAEQVLLRYNYLLSVSKDAQGDFARTSSSWANQTRLLNEQWKKFQGTIGQGFINVLGPVLKMLNTLIARLQVAAQYFTAFTALISGTKQTSTSAAKAVATLGKSTSDTGSSVKKAGKAVKGSLSSFDELNVISQNTSSAMDDIASGADMMTGGLGESSQPQQPVPIDTTQFQPVIDIITKIKELSSQAGSVLINTFGPPLKAVLNDILPPLLAWKSTLNDTFNEVGSLGVPLKAWFTSDLIPFVQTQVTTYGQILAGLLDSSRLVFSGIKDAVMPILNSLVTDGLPLITSFASGALQIFQSLFDNSKIIFDTLWSEGAQPGLTLLSSMMVDTLNIAKEAWNMFGADIILGITTAFSNLVLLFQALWDTFLGPIWTNMLTVMKFLWDKHLKGLADQIAIFVGKLVTGALDIYNKFIIPVTKFLVEILGPAFSKAFVFIENVVGTLLGVVIDVAKGIFKSLGGVIDFIVGIFTGDWSRAWLGVKEIFGGVFDGIVGIAKGAINLIIDAANLLISSLNTIHFNVPDWVPGVGGKGFGINIPSIPKLAQGGLVQAPTLAMVGDNKNASVDPEVVSPLSKLQDMFSVSNQAIVEVLLLILDAIENQSMSLDIDGEKLTRIIRDKLRVEDGRVGRNMVTVGGVPVR